MKPAWKRRSPPDPFSWILTGMAMCVLLAFPVGVIAWAIDARVGFRLVSRFFLLAMGLLALATIGEALRLLLWKRKLNFSLRDLLWLMLTTSLVCTIFVNVEQWMGGVALLTLIASLTLWWSDRLRGDKPLDYGARLIGNGLVVTILLIVIALGLVMAFQVLAMRG